VLPQVLSDLQPGKSWHWGRNNDWQIVVVDLVFREIPVEPHLGRLGADKFAPAARGREENLVPAQPQSDIAREPPLVFRGHQVTAPTQTDANT
jgi:hypothetical protein